MNYSKDIELLKNILELYKGWKEEERTGPDGKVASDSFYRFLYEVVDRNNKDIDFLKKMLRLYTEHKATIADEISKFLQESAECKDAPLDFTRLLNIYREYKSVEPDTAVYHKLLEHAKRYEYDLDFMEKTQKLHKDHRADTGGTYLDFLASANEYKKQEGTFEDSLNLFRECRAVQPGCAYAHYTQILKECGHKHECMRKMIATYKKWQQELDSDLTTFL